MEFLRGKSKFSNMKPHRDLTLKVLCNRKYLHKLRVFTYSNPKWRPVKYSKIEFTSEPTAKETKQNFNKNA